MLLSCIALAGPLLRMDQHLEVPMSLDPDTGTFLYGIGEHTNARGGVTMGLAGRPGLWGVGLRGFIALEQLGRGLTAVPWHAYRANIGLRFVHRRPDPTGHWFFEAGWYHESDHAARIDVIAAPFGVSSGQFPNGTASSNEYLEIALARTGGERLCWTARGIARAYLPNFVPRDQARREVSVGAEGRASWVFHRPHAVWIGGFADITFNDYERTVPVGYRGGPYRYWTIEWGWSNGAIDVYSGVRGGNGRGISFAQVRQPSVTLAGMRTRL